MIKRCSLYFLLSFLPLMSGLFSEDVYSRETHDYIENMYEKGMDLSNEQIMYLVEEGIDAIYDLRVNFYAGKVSDAIYTKNTYKTGYPEGNIKEFVNHIVSELSKLGKEIPLKNRKLYWDFASVKLSQKMDIFIDLFQNQKGGLGHLKPSITDYIEKECRTRAIFG